MVLMSKGALDANDKILNPASTENLHMAVRIGNKGIVARLMDIGADVNAVDVDGNTAVYVAEASEASGYG